MNLAVITGHVLDIKKSRYSKVDGVMEYVFLVLSSEPMSNTINKIPIKAYGEWATLCYANLTTGSYVEIVGGIVRPSPNSFYIHLRSITYKAPKSVRQYYIKSTEFMEIYKPSKLIETLVMNGDPTKKKRKNKDDGKSEEKETS